MSQNRVRHLGLNSTQSQTHRIRQLLGRVKSEAASLQTFASDQQRENATLRQQIEYLQQRVREMQWEKARVEQYLLLEKEKWYPRFLNATRDKREAFCEGCNRKFPEVHLTRCFHLLCGDCYEVQGPMSVSPNGLVSE